MTASNSLAPWACHSEQSRGRLHPEEESSSRSCFQRDRDRIIHSAAFRRLEYKTQVFVNHEGDFFRTRLTHSLEVSQIARSICRTLGLNEDLAEALALAHDLGHPPFGHAGEDALKEMMAPYGGFDHNAQSLRVVTRLEQRYAEFDGLNLTWETLEGIVKHNGPLTGEASGAKTLPEAIAAYAGEHDLELHTFAAAEAQVAALADDIAYNNHDIDDGLRAGLFTIPDLDAVPLVGEMFARGRAPLSEACAVAADPRGGAPADRADGRGPGHRDPAADRAAVAADGRRHPPSPCAGRRLLRGDAGKRPGVEELPVRQHVSPLQAQPDDQQGAPAGARPVSAVRRRARLPAHRLAAARRRARARCGRRASSPTTSPG